MTTFSQSDLDKRRDSSRLMLLLARCYAAATPFVVIPVTSDKFAGAPDLLFIPCVFSLLMLGTLRLDRPAICYLLFLACGPLSVIATIIGGGGALAAVAVLRLPIIFMPYLIALQIRTFSLDDIRLILRTLLVSGLLVIIVGLVMHMLGIEVGTPQRLWYAGGSYARAAGLTGNVAEFGHLTALLIAGLFMYVFTFHTSPPLWFWPVLLICIYALFAISSRAGIVNVLTFLIFAAAPLARWIFRSKTLLGGAAGLALLTPVVAISGIFSGGGDMTRFLITSVGRFESLFLFFMVSGEGDVSSGRLTNWPKLLQYIGDSPLAGYGYKQIWEVQDLTVDNSFLSATLDFGLVGGGGFFLFWVLLLVHFGREALRRGGVNITYFGFVAANFLHSMFVDLYTIWYSMPLFFLLVRMLAMIQEAQARPAENWSDAAGRACA